MKKRSPTSILGGVQEASSARRALLFRGQRGRHGDVPQRPGKLDRAEPGSRARPVPRAQLKVPLARPIGPRPEHVREVGARCCKRSRLYGERVRGTSDGAVVPFNTTRRASTRTSRTFRLWKGSSRYATSPGALRPALFRERRHQPLLPLEVSANLRHERLEPLAQPRLLRPQLQRPQHLDDVDEALASSSMSSAFSAASRAARPTFVAP